MAKSKTTGSWMGDWKVGVRVWVERSGQAVLGEGRADLLAAIDAHHSITKAAKSMRMSYRRAWNLVQEVNAAAGEPLVEAAVGGTKGGGAKLTERGRLAVNLYEQIRGSLNETAAGILQRTLDPRADAALCVHLAAAISLQEALGQILAEYALEKPTVRVRAIFGASNELADHLLAGAPGDLFISAEVSEIDRLEVAKLLAPKSRCTVAANGLAVVGAKGAAVLSNIKSLAERRIKRIALAEPACPLGKYSRDYLKSVKVEGLLADKILHVDNSRAVLAAVVSGVADVGIAFASDAARAERCETLLSISVTRAAATYVAALVKQGKQPVAARELLAFLVSPAAQRAFRRCGLRPAP
ncbi:MAG TPA: molybdate ABC transporter substrate-binding protein [Lacipirellulaceae bacterium]